MPNHPIGTAPAALPAPPATNDAKVKGNAQRTLRHPIFCRGVGLHSGCDVRMTLLPADIGTGIRFQRTDLPNSPPFRVHTGSIIQTRLATVVAPSPKSPHNVATVEHLMAALYAMEIDNVLVQLSGPEVPILDGSADAFTFLLSSAGFLKQQAVRQLIVPEEIIEVSGSHGEKARLVPHKSQTLDLSLSIDFPAPIIGKQHYRARLCHSLFMKELAFCRTFVNYSDVESLQKQGMARGGSLHNALVVNHDNVINPTGLHTPDEFVRHKALDAIGDLYCSGYRICGRFEAYKTGHALNNRLLRALFASPHRWRFVPDRRRLSASP